MDHWIGNYWIGNHWQGNYWIGTGSPTDTVIVVAMQTASGVLAAETAPKEGNQ